MYQKRLNDFEGVRLRFFLKVIYLHSMHPLSPESLSLLPNFQKRGLAGSQFLKGGCWKKGSDIFDLGGGMDCNCYINNKLNLKF